MNDAPPSEANQPLASPLLLDRDASIVLVVDVQEAFLPIIDYGDRVVRATERLLRAATLFDVPRFATEQYPKGLKPTVAELHPGLQQRFEKTAFSVRGAPELVRRLEELRATEGRTQIVLAGFETHVCVLQSALDLLAWGFDVFVLDDAVGARNARFHEGGLARMRDAGAFVACSESVLFEWCRDAADPKFKTVSAMVKEFA